ncbi:MAG: ferrous iron transport protein B, partial [Methanopyri archaeon]|nr:ferrous iron transport protein B [Methanopyri archaeon]
MGLSLVELGAERSGTVESIDGRSNLTRWLDEKGIREGTFIKVVSVPPDSGPVTVDVDGKEVELGRGMADKVIVRPSPRRLVLVGNPNVGKSVIFSHLTGQYAVASNYPGTTVEMLCGNGTIGGEEFEVMDTPGTNSLVPMSEDEAVTRDILLEGADIVLQVADAKNLRRSLVLTLQLLSMRQHVVLALNMWDEALAKGVSIDTELLSQLLGIPVVITVAPESKGIFTLRRRLAEVAAGDVLPPTPDIYRGDAGKAVEDLSDVLSSPQEAVMALSGDTTLNEHLKKVHGKEVMVRVKSVGARLKEEYTRPLAQVFDTSLHKKVSTVHDQVYGQELPSTTSVEEQFSQLTFSPVTAIPILLAVMFLVYQFVGIVGAGVLVDFLETDVFDAHIIPWSRATATLFVPETNIVYDFFLGDFGIISMGLTYAIAIVLPIVGTFFITFGILEDSGYLPRLTIMVNRVFREIGLSGKAILPIVLGFGCGTMAVLTSRILETRKERLIATLLIALAIPCSAQLGVMMGLLAGLSTAALTVAFVTVLLQRIIVGRLAALVIPGEDSDFIMELPPIRRPFLRNIALKTWMRTKWFLMEAIPLFILGTALLFVLHHTGGLEILENALQPV